MIETFRSNPALAGERFDNEVVVIDAMRGIYYSLRGSAADLWTEFSKHARSVSEVIAAFRMDASEQRDTLVSSVETMASLGLLVSAAAEAPSPPLMRGELPFSSPLVEQFTDLAELIAIDPVHEVDPDLGWPVRPSAFPDPRA